MTTYGDPGPYERRARKAANDVDADLVCCRAWPTNAAYSYQHKWGTCGLCGGRPTLVLR